MLILDAYFLKFFNCCFLNFSFFIHSLIHSLFIIHPLIYIILAHQYTVFTRAGATGREAKFLLMTSYFRFSVNVCTMARIILYDDPEDETGKIEITIGDEVSRSRNKLYLNHTIKIIR